MTRGVSSTERVIWSFRERVEVGNWKRYKIGDSVVVARRFRSTICTIVLVFIEHLFSTLPPLAAPALMALGLRTYSSATSKGYVLCWYSDWTWWINRSAITQPISGCF